MEQEATSGQTCQIAPRLRRLAALSPWLGAAGVVTHGLTAAAGLVIGIVCLRLIRADGACDRDMGVVVTGIIVSALVLVMGLLYPPLFASWREKVRQGVCRTNLCTVARATNLYRTDHDDRYPLATSWCDGLTPLYLGSEAYLRRPNAPGSQSAYALNLELSGTRHRRGLPENTVLLFEAGGGWNASGGPEMFASRHSGGGHVALTGGRREWRRGFSVTRLRWAP